MEEDILKAPGPRNFVQRYIDTLILFAPVAKVLITQPESISAELGKDRIYNLLIDRFEKAYPNVINCPKFDTANFPEFDDLFTRLDPIMPQFMHYLYWVDEVLRIKGPTLASIANSSDLVAAVTSATAGLLRLHRRKSSGFSVMRSHIAEVQRMVYDTNGRVALNDGEDGYAFNSKLSYILAASHDTPEDGGTTFKHFGVVPVPSQSRIIEFLGNVVENTPHHGIDINQYKDQLALLNCDISWDNFPQQLGKDDPHIVANLQAIQNMVDPNDKKSIDRYLDVLRIVGWKRDIACMIPEAILVKMADLISNSDGQRVRDQKFWQRMEIFQALNEQMASFNLSPRQMKEFKGMAAKFVDQNYDNIRNAAKKLTEIRATIEEFPVALQQVFCDQKPDSDVRLTLEESIHNRLLDTMLFRFHESGKKSSSKASLRSTLLRSIRSFPGLRLWR